MNSAKEVLAMVDMWKSHEAGPAEIVIKSSAACLGWPYCWGAVGIACTTANRQRYMKNAKIDPRDAELIKKHCQVLNGSAGTCEGCKYYPGGLVDMNDCQGFVKEIFKYAGIILTGGGCTSMWNNNKLWTQKGNIQDMPDVVCCVFQQDPKDKNKKQHIGIHVGGGYIIHCSVEVKEGKTSDKAWTHYAIPKGMDEPIPEPTPTHKTIRKGATGPEVVELQNDLIALDYDLTPYGADGKFGAKTETALKAFQKANGLVADGICGQKSWTALEEAIKPKPQKLYTVTIKHLDETQAKAMKTAYANSEMKEED